ncbi:MAG: DNA translocase FtsK [Paludibacteraceae bacterium]|nr:DNA translocase FtsK [Paludibacteraceae bacterium]
MAKKDKDKTKEEKTEKVKKPNRLVRFFKDDRTRICAGLFIVIGCLYFFLAFISFFFTGAEDQSILQSADPGTTLDLRSNIKNWTGYRGAYLADFFINHTFGVSCFFPLFFVSIIGIRGLGIKKLPVFRTFVLCSFALFWVSLFFGFFFIPAYESSFLYLGGDHGYYLSKWLEAQIGWVGTFLFLGITLLAFMIMEFSATLPFLKRMRDKLFKKKEPEVVDPNNAGDNGEQPVGDGTDGENPNGTGEGENGNGDSENPASGNDLEKPENGDDNNSGEGAGDENVGKTEILHISDSDEGEDQPKEGSNGLSDNVDGVGENESQFQPEASETAAVAGSINLAKEEKGGFEITVAQGTDDDMVSENIETPQTKDVGEPENPTETVGFDVVKHEVDTLPEEDLTKPYDPTLDLSNYKYPTIDLLKQYPNVDNTINMEEQNANKDKIVETLSNYGIKIDRVAATVGPTVTLYEIVPAPGTRIAKIKNLENDIALSLAALGIRIIAPIPGKGTIGIEVPNSTAQIVPMRNVIASKKFQETKYDLPVVFGRTITNEVFMADLAKMPHLLVAGATGQGKSVGLNAIITSLLYKKHPSQLKLVMVDPKKVEFTVYSNIDHHFLAKLPDEEDAIVTDVTKVVQTLSSLCKEMDTRYDLLKAARVRNIKEYNEKFINRHLNPNNGHRYLPYIVVIIDEFGDLIMTAGKEVELPIARIAQLARAVGIHMVIATQRPTTNIITGTIKANFPARIAFRVASMIDSRTILDAPGANQLIGRGDMLYLQGSDMTRVQCAFVDTPEVERITEYIAEQQGYPTAFLLPEVDSSEGGESGAADVDMNKLDPMFDQAAELIVSEQLGSTSLIQRKFALGYNRAGRIMDQLEAAGIVGPARGSKPREVLVVDLFQLEGMLSSLRKK